MANTIPGLQQLDDAGRPQQFQGRPVVSPEAGAQDPSLQPVASPVDTFVRAAQPATNAPELGRIADALSAFQPELAQFSMAQKMLNNQQAQGNVPQLLGGQNADQMRDTLKSNPQLQSVAAARMGQHMLGSTQANETLAGMQQDYLTHFDREHGDFDQFVNGYIQKDLKANPDPFFAKGYMERVQSGVEALRNAQTQFQAGYQKDTQDALIGGAVRSGLDQGIEKGQSPADVYAGLQQSFGAIKAVAGRPYSEQQQLLLGEIEKQAVTLGTAPDYEKRFAMIRGLLQQDRGTQNGVAVGSMLDSPTLGGKAAQVLMHATQQYENRFEVQNQDVLGSLREAARTADPSYSMRRDQLIQEHPLMVRGAAIQRMDSMWDAAKDRSALGLQKVQLQQAADREQNNFLNDHVLPALQNGTAAGGLQDATIHDAKGNPVTYTVDQQIKDGTAAVQSQIDRQYAGKENDPAAQAQKFQTEVRLYAGNGQTNPAWKRQLNAGYASAMTSAGGEEANITPDLQQGYALYKQLGAASQAALNNHASGNADKLYSLAQDGEEAGLSETQSLKMAVMATGNKEFIKNLPSLSMNDVRQDITSALGSQSHWFAGDNLSSVDNSSLVEARVKEFAELLHGAGHVPLDQAIKLSAARIAKQYQVINGTAVNVSGKGLPGNFGDLANGVITNWWQDHGAEEAKMGHSQSDLTIHQLGNTPQWALFYKDGTQPYSPHAAFGLPELYGVANQRSNEANTNLGPAYKQRNEARQIGNTIFGNGGAFVSP